MEQSSTINNRWSIPLMMGLVIAAVKMVFTTIENMFFTDSTGGMLAVTLGGFIVVVALLIMTGKMQRKAMGGCIRLKDAFMALFVCALVIAILNYTYDMIYIKIIDPGMADRLHESSIAQAEKIGLPQESIDDMNRKHAEDMNGGINIGKQFLKVIISVMVYTIIAWICALFVRTKDIKTPQQA